MKYLDARKGPQKDSVIPENKMQPGSRADQRLDPKDPQSLVSSPRSGRGTETASVQALAKQLDVDLTNVKGTGPDGQITEKDVRLAKRQQSSGGQSGQENK